MIVNEFRTKERLPVALRSSGTAFEEVGIEIESTKTKCKNRGTAVQLRKVEYNLNCYQSCPDSGVHFTSCNHNSANFLIYKRIRMLR